MSTAKSDSKPAEILPGESILLIPQIDVFVDYDWNVRSKSAIMSETSDAVQDTTLKGEHLGEGTGLYGLCLDLHMTGQDTAVVVRRVENGKSLGGKKTDLPFELVCGFRRFTALELVNGGKPESFGKPDSKDAKALAESIVKAKKEKRPVVPNTTDGAIRAVVRVLTPTAARILNGKENTNRDNLSTPDMVRYVAILSSVEKLNQVQIAEALGIGQPHVSRLLRIAGLPKGIVAHWAGESKLPGLPDTVQERLTSRQLVELFDETKGQTDAEITARYVLMLNPPAPDPNNPDASGDAVAKRIKDIAVLLAGLIRNGVVSADSLSWARVIGPKKDGFIIDTGKADAGKRGEYWDLMDREFTKALDPGKAAKTQKDKDDTAAN